MLRCLQTRERGDTQRPWIIRLDACLIHCGGSLFCYNLNVDLYCFLAGRDVGQCTGVGTTSSQRTEAELLLLASRNPQPSATSPRRHVGLQRRLMDGREVPPAEEQARGHRAKGKGQRLGAARRDHRLSAPPCRRAADEMEPLITRPPDPTTLEGCTLPRKAGAAAASPNPRPTSPTARRQGGADSR